jgi:rhamnosyltransferase
MRRVLENAEGEPMIHKGRSAAIVVTFHPRAEYMENLAKMSAQVDLLVIVDNGSAEDKLALLRNASKESGWRLMENGANLGIATALNRGIRQAQTEGCDWVFLFDQDSELTPGFAATMIAEFQSLSQTKKIMQIIPRYHDSETGLDRPISVFEDGGIFLTITSGSLFSMRAFEQCGLFAEDLFIYCVDDEYSLRIRKKGFYIGLSKDAVLLHQSGHPTYRKFLGRSFATKNYRPEVRYYYARNKIWILRAYGRAFPRLIVPTIRELISIPLKIAWMEETPWRKVRLYLRGLTDGLAGRMGPLRP